MGPLLRVFLYSFNDLTIQQNNNLNYTQQLSRQSMNKIKITRQFNTSEVIITFENLNISLIFMATFLYWLLYGYLDWLAFMLYFLVRIRIQVVFWSFGWWASGVFPISPLKTSYGFWKGMKRFWLIMKKSRSTNTFRRTCLYSIPRWLKAFYCRI